MKLYRKLPYILAGINPIMRPRVDWMRGPDDSILELLHETDMILTPKVIAYHVDFESGYIRSRLRVLSEHGLVSSPDQDEIPKGLTGTGAYRITELGRQYLRGDLSREELE